MDFADPASVLKRVEEQNRRSLNRSQDFSDQNYPGNAIRSYIPIPGAAGANELAKFSSQGVAPTAENAKKVLDLMRSASDSELVILTVMLARFHNRDNSTTKNEEILAKLKKLARHPDHRVARSAARGLARMAPVVPGVEEALAAARDSGALSPDSYEAERVWVALTSPPKDQARILREIATTKNKYATQVAAFVLLGHPDAVKVLQPESISALKDMVIHTEPTFSKNTSEAGLWDLFNYSDWIQLYGRLEYPDNWSASQHKIIERLNSPTTDPRAIVAYLSSTAARRARRDPAFADEIALLTNKATVYLDQFPHDPYLVGRRKAIFE